MTATIITHNPPTLPPTTGYSQIVEVRAARTIYVAGQVSVNTKGEFVGVGNFEAQAEQVFHNLTAALASVGCTASDLVKLTVYMLDMENLMAYRAARVKFFGSVTPAAAPAVTLVQVSRLYAPEILLEVEAVAAVNQLPVNEV